MQTPSVRKKYYLSLKKKINAHCYTLDQRLRRFPIKLLNKIKRLEIPEEETIIIQEESFPLKEKLPELFTNYKELKKKSKARYYQSYLSSFLKESNKKEAKEMKEIYVKIEEDLSREIESQKETLYESLTILNQTIKFMKKKIA